MEESRLAKGEVERFFYNIDKKRKSAPTTGVSLIHFYMHKNKDVSCCCCYSLLLYATVVSLKNTLFLP